jgi:hypothetical protein
MVGEEKDSMVHHRLTLPEQSHYSRALKVLEVLVGDDQALLPSIHKLQGAVEKEGRKIDCSDFGYFEGLEASLRLIPFVGGANSRWARWKKLSPPDKQVWEEILRRKWQDPKHKPPEEFVYDQATPCSPHEAAKMVQSEQEMWDLGVLEFEPAPLSPGCLLRHFPVPKDDGTFRIVVDAKQASENEATPRFKGRGPADLLRFLKRDHKYARTDAKKFFWQVESRPRQRPYQRLHSAVYPGRIARFRSMPMGYKGPPRVAHELMKVVEHRLDTLFSVEVYTYVDELLNGNESTAGCYLDTFITRTVLTWLGIHTNFKKSDAMVPTRTTQFCGVRSDSRNGAAAASRERLSSIRTLATEMVEVRPTGHHMSRLLGSVRTLGFIHLKQSFSSIGCSKVLGAFIGRHGGRRRELKASRITEEEWGQIRDELAYWSAPNPDDEWSLWPPTQLPVARVTCDASNYGWAGEELSLRPPFITQDWFVRTERQLSHCAMEYLAATRTVKALVSTGQLPKGSVQVPVLVQVRSDNQTTVTAINKMRSRNAEICKIAVPFTQYLRVNCMQLEAVHVVKQEMDDDHMVDRVGRLRSRVWDRCLPEKLFQQVLLQLGCSGSPILDLAATAASTQSEAYVSRRPDGEARWCNMLSELWDPIQNNKIRPEEQLYVFPPANLLDKVLRHVEQSRCTSVVVVFPVWSRPFLRTICSMLRSEVILFQGGPQLLVPPEGEYIADQVTLASWTWGAALIGCSSSDSSAPPTVGVKRLSMQPSLVDGNPVTASSTTQVGSDGSTFCLAEARLQACCTGRHRLSQTFW